MAVDPYIQGQASCDELHRKKLVAGYCLNGGGLTTGCASRECAVPLGRFTTVRLAVLCIAPRERRTVKIGFGGLSHQVGLKIRQLRLCQAGLRSAAMPAIRTHDRSLPPISEHEPLTTLKEVIQSCVSVTRASFYLPIHG